jgi:hypothetical protein
MLVHEQVKVAVTHPFPFCWARQHLEYLELIAHLNFCVQREMFWRQRIVWDCHRFAIPSPHPHKPVVLNRGQVSYLDPLAEDCRWHLYALTLLVERPAVVRALDLTAFDRSKREGACAVRALVVNACNCAVLVPEEHPLLVEELHRHEHVLFECRREGNRIPAHAWPVLTSGNRPPVLASEGYCGLRFQRKLRPDVVPVNPL